LRVKTEEMGAPQALEEVEGHRMARSIWKGAISFGLVNVPVKLYSAVQKKTVRFNQLHDADGVRIQQKRICPADGEEVPFEHVVKGFEVSPDRYVVISPDELEALAAEKTRTIDIEDFVELDEIDPLYYEHPYYLAPDTGAAKAYSLLLAALEQSRKVAIARVVLRSKEYLVAIRAADGVLTMETMLFADELVSPDQLEELPGRDVKASDRELQMAQQLIDSLSADFDPTKYRDEYRERVLDLIDRKAGGEEVSLQPLPEKPAKVPDLMAALEASLANVKKERPKPGGGSKAKATRSTKQTKEAKETKEAARSNGSAAKRAPAKRRREKVKTGK
jgi:DNA end-binding protein Ku